MDDELMLFPEVVKRSRQSEATMRWLIHKGEGPPHGVIGWRLVFKRSQVERWIEEAFGRSEKDATPAA